ncbi:MAG: glycosyltransferase family 39 protein [Alphaproteobacteria bacterium]|nr:glycosyltransferase family 39 protein [Alphaproteobacteria bacterium]
MIATKSHSERSADSLAIKVFALIMVLFVIIQVLTTIQVLEHFPNGFETEDFYHPAAVNLLEHGTYGFGEAPNIQRTTFRPPLYAAALAGVYGLFGTNELIGLVLNNVLLAGLLIVVFHVGRIFSPWVGVLAACLLMLDPVYLSHANRNQSDMLFGFLLTLFLLFGLKATTRPLNLWMVALSAATLGLAVLTRVAALYMWIPFCIVLVAAHWRGKPSRTIAAVVIVIALHGVATIPWMERNRAIDGNSAFASMKGWHLVSFYAPLFIAKRDGIDAGEAKRNITESILGDPSFLALSDGEKEKFLVAQGTRMVKENWPYALGVILDNIPKMFLGYPSEPVAVHLGDDGFAAWQEMNLVRHETSFQAKTWSVSSRVELIRYYLDTGLYVILGYGVGLKILNALVLLLAAATLFRWLLAGGREKRNLALFIILVFGILAGTALLTTTGRFRLPIMPALTPIAAIALFALVGRFCPWRSSKVTKERYA